MTTKAEEDPRPTHPSVVALHPASQGGERGWGSSLSPEPQVHFLFSEHPAPESLCQTQLAKGQDLLSQKHLHWKCPGLSWWSVVKSPPANAGGHGFNSLPRKIPHATRQQSH